jgi:hypothetical protein
MNNELFRVVDSVAFDNPNLALSARQGYLLNQRISQLSLFSISDGLVPIGAVIAIAGVFSGANNTGVFTVASSADNNLAGTGNISKNGFQLCDGKKVSDEAVSFFRNGYMPNLTDDRYLKGSSSSGVISVISGANLGDNRVILGNAELPAHIHTATTVIDNHQASTQAFTNISTTSVAQNTSASSGEAGWHGHSIHFQQTGGAAGLPGNNIYYTGPYPLFTDGAGNHTHPIYVSNPAHSHTFSITVNFPSHIHTGVATTIASTGSGLPFNIEPKYITVQYYMRVR